MLTIYTDGSYKPSVNENVSGWGAFFKKDNGETFSLNGVVEKPEMRQIDGELEAVQKSLELAEELGESEITIVYDYKGVEEWAEQRWKTNKTKTTDYKHFISTKRKKGLQISFSWVKGHTGDEGNEKADNLAGMAVKGEFVNDFEL